MENPELLLLELEEFNRSHDQDQQIPQNLANFIEHVAKTGTYIFPWSIIKKLYLQKLNNVLSELSSIFTATALAAASPNADNNSMNASLLNSSDTVTSAAAATSNQLIKERIVNRMKSFSNAPFTIQRISEILLKPNQHYTRADKFLRGLEKCIMVVTTIDPNGNKIFIENAMSNGTLSDSPSPAATPVRPGTPVQAETSETTPNDSTPLPVESND